MVCKEVNNILFIELPTTSGGYLSFQGFRDFCYPRVNGLASQRTRKNDKAEGVQRLFLENVSHRFEFPRRILLLGVDTSRAPI